MPLPKSVQEQVEKATQHFAEPENTATEAAPEDDTRNPPEGDTSTADQEAHQTTEGREPDPEQPADTSQADKPDTDRDAFYWKHRYDVIQGKYNKEVPALHQEVRTLKGQLEERDQRIAQLEQQEGAPSGKRQDVLSDTELEEMRATYGDDLVNDFERLIAARTGGGQADKIARLEQELDAMRHKEQAREQENLEDAKARFWATLEAGVPKWREVNADPAFHAFLAQPDEQTGEVRQTLLEAAQQRLDADGVVRIFRHFQNQANPQPARDPARVPEDQLDPPRSRHTGPTDNVEGKRIWTGQAIREFYEDKRRGHFSRDEAARLEADIFAAQQEGRVR